MDLPSFVDVVIALLWLFVAVVVGRAAYLVWHSPWRDEEDDDPVQVGRQPGTGRL